MKKHLWPLSTETMKKLIPIQWPLVICPGQKNLQIFFKKESYNSHASQRGALHTEVWLQLKQWHTQLQDVHWMWELSKVRPPFWQHHSDNSTPFRIIFSSHHIAKYWISPAIENVNTWICSFAVQILKTDC